MLGKIRKERKEKGGKRKEKGGKRRKKEEIKRETGKSERLK